MMPQKFKKSRQLYTCIKCQRRFANRIECQNHVMAHLREQKLAARAAHQQTELKPELNDEMQEIDEEMLSTYMHEEEDSQPADFHCTAVDEVVEQAHQAYQKQHINKEEKHSHTSGSASPSSTHHLAEGFFHPLNGTTSTAGDKFPNYQTQSFVMRVAGDVPADQSEVIQDVCDQLLGTLPVRQLINRPFRLTFDFQPLNEEGPTATTETKPEEMVVELPAENV